ncbi:hypothetical protein P4261_26710 [Bacillus thuringiensis]|nr:hypothetical protein [Bacillus thuringiensis]MED2812248.1 hypothetical protein [Bacillus thuringiensis]MED2830283.1 hypothetical protein [Bacillus thuringiensis]MED2834027.1 hypothetical protein [Bacillus thuringiensis]MED2848845.1 hypothetical protein [Bacillus thuringiensis]
MKKQVSIFALMILSVFIVCTVGVAKSSYDWHTGVDIPFTYIPNISVENEGIGIKCSQSLYSEKHTIKYELVKKKFLSDEVFDSVEVKGSHNPNESFFIKLRAPKGEGYHIRISGSGHGNIGIIPYEVKN